MPLAAWVCESSASATALFAFPGLPCRWNRPSDGRGRHQDVGRAEFRFSAPMQLVGWDLDDRLFQELP
jgi:hypothetical protein